MPSELRRGIAWSLAGAFFGGCFVIPWKLANELGSPATSTVALLAFAALFNTLLGVAQHRHSARPRLEPYELGVALALAVLSLLGNLGSATAVQTLSASLLNVLLRGEVLVVALLAWVVLGERVERRFWLGAGLAGCGLLVLHGPLEGGPVAAQGTGFALLAVLAFSAMAVLTRQGIRRIDPVRVNALRLWASLPLWFLAVGTPADLGTVGAAQLGYAALAAFAGPTAARLCLILSARHVDARITALGALSAPAISLGLEVVVLGHVPPPRELMGGAILLAGIAVPLARRDVLQRVFTRSSDLHAGPR